MDATDRSAATSGARHAPAAGPGATAVVSAAALIAGLTVLARVVGFGRTAVFGWVVTDNDLGDIYIVANTVPNIIFELVAGGALASLVVPLLAGAIASGDRARVAAITSALLTWTLTLLLPLAVAVALLAEPIVTLIAADASPAQLATGARMLRIFAPQLPLYGLGIVLTGVLQAHRRFAWPVVAPLLSSVTVIAAYLTFGLVDGRGPDLNQVSRGGELILSVGTTAGVVILSLCLLIPLRRLGLSFRPGYAFPPEARATVTRLAWAGAVTVGAQQVALLVALGQALAGPPGTNVRFNFAQTVFLLPWAVLAVPLATAAYPGLATAHSVGDTQSYRETLSRTTRMVLLVSCLGAAALAALAAPASRFLLDAGPSTGGSTGGGADALAAGIAGFAPGLIGYGLFAVLSRALYARGSTASAAAAIGAGWTVVAVGALVLAAVMPADQRVLALGLAHSTGMLVLGALLIMVVVRRAGPAALAGVGRATLVGLLSAAVATGAGLAAVAATDAGISAMVGADGAAGGTPARIFGALQGMLCSVVVLAVFFGVAYPLDRRDVRPIAARLTRRLRRTARDGGDRS